MLEQTFNHLRSNAHNMCIQNLFIHTKFKQENLPKYHIQDIILPPLNFPNIKYGPQMIFLRNKDVSLSYYFELKSKCKKNPADRVLQRFRALG